MDDPVSGGIMSVAQERLNVLVAREHERADIVLGLGHPVASPFRIAIRVVVASRSSLGGSLDAGEDGLEETDVGRVRIRLLAQG